MATLKLHVMGVVIIKTSEYSKTYCLEFREMCLGREYDRIDRSKR